MRVAILQRPSLHLLLISLLGLLAYSNTFNVPFQWDEAPLIEKNPIIKNLGYFLEPAKAEGAEYYDALKRRYIGYLSFALNYRFHGLDVTGYHVVNLALHILNAMLVYAFVRLTLRTPFLKKPLTPCPSPSGRGAGGEGQFVALFSALLFVSHPVQTEAVTYIFQRLASLAAFFYLASIVLYVKWRLTSLTLNPSPTGRGQGVRVILYLLSLLSAVLAMKTKENAFTLPIVIALYELLFFKGGITRRIARLAPLLLTLLIVPLTLLDMNKPVDEITGGIGAATRGYEEISRQDYLFTQFRVIITYIRLLLLPANQNIDYDYPIFHSFGDFQVLASFLFLSSVAAFGIYLLICSRRGAPALRVLAFGIFFFFITLAVESSVIPLSMVINEYRLYLPSVGFFLATTTGAFLFLERLKGKKALPFAVSSLILIPIVLSSATFARNTAWRSGISLWEDVVKKSPNKARGHYNLGNYYKAEGLIEKAIEQYKIALVLKPEAEAYNNLGNIYASKGMTETAVEQYRAALILEPYSESIHLTHYNLGAAYLKLGLPDNAVEHYQTALKIKPDYAEAHNGLGVAYFQVGHKEKAIEHFRLALKIRPGYAEAMDNLRGVTDPFPAQ